MGNKKGSKRLTDDESRRNMTISVSKTTQDTLIAQPMYIGRFIDKLVEAHNNKLTGNDND